MTQRWNVVFFFLCTLNAVSFSQTELIVNTILDKKVYAPGDTAVVALECIIPEGHHLYGNPLGPGIGKPLESLLHHLGGRSIPFLAVFSGNDPNRPVIMRDIVKKKEVLRTLSELRQIDPSKSNSEFSPIKNVVAD